MRGDAFKFLAGSAAAFAYAHAACAVAVAKGVINQPVFLGRKWPIGLLWAEAAVYSAAGVALAYRGWRHADHAETLAAADRADLPPG